MIVYIIIKIEYDWQHVLAVCLTEEIAIRERDKARAFVDNPDHEFYEEYNPEEAKKCIKYTEYEVIEK